MHGRQLGCFHHGYGDEDCCLPLYIPGEFTTRVVQGDAELEQRLRDPAYPDKVERAVLFTVEAWDVNCPQHIQQRFTQRQLAPAIEQLQSRIAELEAEIQRLRLS